MNKSERLLFPGINVRQSLHMYEKAQKQIDESIRKLLCQGASWDYIASTEGVSKRRISQIAKGQEINHKRGAPKVTDEQVEQFIYQSSLADARISSERMTEIVNKKFDMHLSKHTVRRIRLSQGFNYHPPLVEQALSPEQCRIKGTRKRG